MTDVRSADDTVLRVQDLLLNSDDINEFLEAFTEIIADRLSGDGERVWCAVTLMREKKATTVASSSPQAEALDEIQNRFTDGPCMTAMRTHTLTRVDDTREDPRWPDYHVLAAQNGVLSVLGVPFELAGEGLAALNMYSNKPYEFDDADKVERVQAEVLHASNALLLALRLCRHSQAAADLRRAMASRTTIDLAVGIVMAQNRCSQERAVEILKGASSHRNIKLNDLATQMVATFDDSAPETHFDD